MKVVNCLFVPLHGELLVLLVPHVQGGFNRAVRTSTAFTVYSTDDLTILATGPLTEDGSLNPITAVDPT